MTTDGRPRSSITDITQDFLRRIHSGEFRGGVPLPSHDALVDQYGTTQSVIQNVYATLRSMGAVASVRGHAMYLQDTYSVWAHPDSEQVIATSAPTKGELQLASDAMASGTSSLAGQVAFALRSALSVAAWSDCWGTKGAVNVEWQDGPSITQVITQLLPSHEIRNPGEDMDSDPVTMTWISGIPTLRLLNQTEQTASLRMTSPDGTRLFLNRLQGRDSTKP